MESYCLKSKENTENKDPKSLASSNGRVMILSKCAICGSKKSRFIKNQEAKRLLSKLGIIHMQSNTMSSNIRVLIKIYYICPSFIFGKLSREKTPLNLGSF